LSPIRRFVVGVLTDGDIEFWATNHLKMNELFRLKYAEISWAIEEYHRGIKQFVGVERCMLRQAKAQRNHIGLALRAFLRLERYCFETGLSWFAPLESSCFFALS